MLQLNALTVKSTQFSGLHCGAITACSRRGKAPRVIARLGQAPLIVFMLLHSAFCQCALRKKRERNQLSLDGKCLFLPPFGPDDPRSVSQCSPYLLCSREKWEEERQHSCSRCGSELDPSDLIKICSVILLTL